ncbi:MAG: lipoyl synthase [bacterium]
MSSNSAFRIPHSAFPRKPRWLKAPLPSGQGYQEVRSLIEEHGLHTVCKSARCPNLGTCWDSRTATFMILGDICTRACRFCAVRHGQPVKPGVDEPSRVAKAISRLSLDYAVVTSVTRDDLPDGGASIFAETVTAIKKQRPECRVEVLVPDFGGSVDALDTVLEAKPDVLNHNAETVPRLYPEVRPGAGWERSLRILEQARQKGFLTKSGLMVGLGESGEELRLALAELAEIGTDILTIGQYLAPTVNHYPVRQYVPLEEFEEIRLRALSLGFRFVVSSPLARSSYRAKEAYEACFMNLPA